MGPQINEPEYDPHENNAANDISEGDGKEVVEKKSLPGKLGKVQCFPCHFLRSCNDGRIFPEYYPHGNKIHVCHTVFKSAGDEPAYREYNRKNLVCHTSSAKT